MDPSLPAPLVAALLDAGYRVAGPAGVGGGGPVWTAVRVGPAGRASERVVVQVLAVPDGDAGARLAARLQALWELAHPHLPEVVDVVTVPGSGGDGETWGVLLAEVPGATVAALLAARGRLSVGEVVTLTVPVAGALDALHRVGLVHGDVSPANLVVRPDGRPVLIDVLGRAADGGADSGGGARGTPGFAAPELLAPPGGRGRVGRSGTGPDDGGLPAAAPADVFSLATVALAALDLASHDGRLGEELRAACAVEPVRRPTAAELAGAVYACAEPEPIGQPDAGVLARTALAQLAAPDRTVSVPTGGRHRAHRAGGHVRRRLAVACVAVGLVAAAWGAVGLGSRAGDGGEQAGTAARRPPVAAVTAAPADPATPGVGPPPSQPAPRSTADTPDAAESAPPEAERAATGRDDPVAAAATLTRRRAVVLASGDMTGLAEVEIPGSPAHRADRAVMEGLATDGVTLDGVSAVVERAVLVPSGPSLPSAATQVSAPAGTTVDVRVRAGLTAHTRQSPAGVTQVAAEQPRDVVLRLTWTDGGWRVAEVLPG